MELTAYVKVVSKLRFSLCLRKRNTRNSFILFHRLFSMEKSIQEKIKMKLNQLYITVKPPMY